MLKTDEITENFTNENFYILNKNNTTTMTNKTRCPHKLTSGARPGEICGAAIKDDSGFCGIHNKNKSAPKAKVEADPKLEVEKLLNLIDKSTLEDTNTQRIIGYAVHNILQGDPAGVALLEKYFIPTKQAKRCYNSVGLAIVDCIDFELRKLPDNAEDPFLNTDTDKDSIAVLVSLNSKYKHFEEEIDKKYNIDTLKGFAKCGDASKSNKDVSVAYKAKFTIEQIGEIRKVRFGVVTWNDFHEELLNFNLNYNEFELIKRIRGCLAIMGGEKRVIILNTRVESKQTFEFDKFVKAYDKLKGISLKGAPFKLGSFIDDNWNLLQYSDIVFKPYGIDQEWNDYTRINTFRGFQAKYVPDWRTYEKEIEPLITHIRDRLHVGEMETFHYVMCWILALLKEGKVPKANLIYVSNRGAGKTLFIDYLIRQKLFGEYSAECDCLEDFTEVENSRFEKACCIVVNEVKGETKHDQNKLKSVTTRDTFTLKRLYKNKEDVDKYFGLIMSTNFDVGAWAVDRRNIVVRCSDELCTEDNDIQERRDEVAALVKPILNAINNYSDIFYSWLSDTYSEKLANFDLSGFTATKYKAERTNYFKDNKVVRQFIRDRSQRLKERPSWSNDEVREMFTTYCKEMRLNYTLGPWKNFRAEAGDLVTNSADKTLSYGGKKFKGFQFKIIEHKEEFLECDPAVIKRVDSIVDIVAKQLNDITDLQELELLREKINLKFQNMIAYQQSKTAM